MNETMKLEIIKSWFTHKGEPTPEWEDGVPVCCEDNNHRHCLPGCAYRVEAQDNSPGSIPCIPALMLRINQLETENAGKKKPD